jgi:hypothetical protein
LKSAPWHDSPVFGDDDVAGAEFTTISAEIAWLKPGAVGIVARRLGVGAFSIVIETNVGLLSDRCESSLLARQLYPSKLLNGV